MSEPALLSPLTNQIVTEALGRVAHHAFRDVELTTLMRRFLVAPSSIIAAVGDEKFSGEQRNPGKEDAVPFLPKPKVKLNLKAMSGAQLISIAMSAALSDAELLTDCWLELTSRRRQKPAKQLESLLRKH